MTFQGVIFDVDGVLVDSPHEQAWREAMRELMESDWAGVRAQTTWSPDAMKTGMLALPYGMRCVNFLALSDSPVTFDSTRWNGLVGSLRDENGRLIFA